MATLKRQFITDGEGNALGIILPLEEYALVENLLGQSPRVPTDTDKLAQMERATNDALFLADLQAVMEDFTETDAEWWEPQE